MYIACGYTDLRKGIDGLATLVQSQFQLDPFTNTLFLFCGRRKDRIKALYWEGNGFVLLYKRLESGSFQWPRNGEEVRKLTAQPENQRHLIALKRHPLWHMQKLCQLSQPAELRSTFFRNRNAVLCQDVLCKNRYPSPICTRFDHHFHALKPHCIFRPSESKETVGVSPPSREKQVQVHGRESTGVLFWKEMAKERFAKRSSACHLFRLESFSFAHGVISIDEDLVGTVLNPVQHSIC